MPPPKNRRKAQRDGGGAGAGRTAGVDGPPVRATVVKYRGILFDLDGTLGDTLPVVVAAFQHVFRKYAGRDFTAPEILAMFGPDEEGVLRRRVPQQWQAALADYLAEYTRLHAACAEPFVGIRPLLVALRKHGVRLGVVTAKGAPSAAISARIWHLENQFEAIEAGSVHGANKPEGMRRFLARWDLPVRNVAYVGDAPHDVDAAREVGVTALAAAWAPGARITALAARKPDRLFRTVSGLAAWLEADN